MNFENRSPRGEEDETATPRADNGNIREEGNLNCSRAESAISTPRAERSRVIRHEDSMDLRDQER